MLKALKGKTNLLNYVCAALTLCLLILQFMPFWNTGNESVSINGYVWNDCTNAEIANWFSSQLGTAPNINSIVITTIVILLCGGAGVVLCIMKSQIGFMALLPAAASLFGIYAFAFKPVFRLGSTWVIQLLLCIAILAVSVITVVLYINESTSEVNAQKAVSQSDIDARVAAIEALGNKKSSKSEDSDANFHKLLMFLNDDIPECRAAAAQTLGKTSRDIAFTHISYLIQSEKDEKVLSAMRSALISIKANIKAEHAAKS